MTNSYKLAERINSDVNARVTYKSDLEQFGTPEYWCLPTAFSSLCVVTYVFNTKQYR
ncbi:MAG: transglutaminase-like cysteine peptidase [Candidatus Riesia sp.]|nr:transglutaminase-like cysteine peptidase [Candidatus Riesia sp.]